MYANIKRTLSPFKNWCVLESEIDGPTTCLELVSVLLLMIPSYGPVSGSFH